jgi:integrase
MARPTNKLNAKEVEAVVKDSRQGRYEDGGGLRLQVVGGSAVWVWRGMVRGKRVELGIGSARNVTLKDARDRAHDMREAAAAGGDPRSERKGGLTFAEAAKQVHKLKAEGWSEGKHQTQWLSRLETHAFPVLGKKLVSEIEPGDVHDVLAPIWLRKAETGRRVKQAIGEIFDWAAVKNYRPANLVNPATPVTRGLNKQNDVVKHHPAVPWRHVPAFLVKVHESPSYDSPRWALEFMLLTAARTKEIRLAEKAEIDFEARCWNKPAEHMKGKKGKRRPHSVPLSDQAIELLRDVFKRWPNSKLLFPGRDLKSPLSLMALDMLMRRLPDVPSDTPGRAAVPHGLRSSFKDWSRQPGNKPAVTPDGKPDKTQRWDDDLSEDALAHIEPDMTKRAYSREELCDARAPMMQAWANYCTGKPAAAGKPAKTRKGAKPEPAPAETAVAA